MKTCQHKVKGRGWDQNGKWHDAEVCGKELPFQIKRMKKVYEHGDYCAEHAPLHREAQEKGE